MMGIVQLLTADQYAEREDIRGSVDAIVIAITPVVSNTMTNASRSHRNPHHLDSPHCHTNHTKQQEIDNQHQRYSLPAKTGVQIACHPVVRRTVTVFLNRF